jgi:hypothetical protein
VATDSTLMLTTKTALLQMNINMSEIHILASKSDVTHKTKNKFNELFHNKLVKILGFIFLK